VQHRIRRRCLFPGRRTVRLVEQQAQRLDGGRKLPIDGGYDGLAELIGIGAQDVMTLAVDHLGLAAPETDCVVTAQRCE
jgi:hypothetical protein